MKKFISSWSDKEYGYWFRQRILKNSKWRETKIILWSLELGMNVRLNTFELISRVEKCGEAERRIERYGRKNWIKKWGNYEKFDVDRERFNVEKKFRKSFYDLERIIKEAASK